jgi:phenylalanyl-tRNA synthetase beta chain
MKFSYKQLQTYFEDTLPTPEKLAEAVTFHAFEIESLEKEGDDTIMDIKVLPDRACYAKSYEGVALEISAILGLKRDQSKIPVETGEVRTIPFHLHDITDVLGVPIPKEEVANILESLGIHVDVIADSFAAKVPSNRLDITHWRDLPEEIGRIYGYDKIPAKTPSPLKPASAPHAESYYAEKIKNILVAANFSEVYTYTLVPKGVYEMEKPLAADKNHLRTNLTDGITQSLELNARNSDLLGLDEIKVFEIGTVFTEKGEHTSLCVGIKNIKKKQTPAKDKIKVVRDQILAELGAKASILCTVDDTGGIISLGGKAIGMTNNSDGIFELNLTELVATLPVPTSYEDLGFGKAPALEYRRFSPYPFIVRDIAVFVPDQVTALEVWGIIAQRIGEGNANMLLARHSLFDEFKKEGKVSYAFRIVFQSAEKTLTDGEVGSVMEKITEGLKEKGWEVR